MVDDYADFEVTVGEGTGNKYPIRARCQFAGELTAQATIALAREPKIRDGLSILEKASFTDQERATLRDMGTRLLDLILVGDVGKAYYVTLGFAEGSKQRMRFRLKVDAPELKRLPWEYMFDRFRGGFLVWRDDFVLARSLQAVATPPPEPPTRLRVLLLLSRPKDTTGLDLVTETESIQAALQSLADRGNLELTILDNPTSATIRETLAQQTYHIVHYSGHAYFKSLGAPNGATAGVPGGPERGMLPPTQPLPTALPAMEKAFVVLPGPQGVRNDMEEEAFAAFFTGFRDLRLVVLNACQTATSSGTERLSGLGDLLVTAGVPMVVAMQYPIRDMAANLFATELYRALAARARLGAAMTQARRALYQEFRPNDRSWGTPVVYMRSDDDRLFQ